MTTGSLIEKLERQKVIAWPGIELTKPQKWFNSALAAAIETVRHHLNEREKELWMAAYEKGVRDVFIHQHESDALKAAKADTPVTPVEVSNMLHRLNLDRPDIAALPEGATIACNITTLRQAADLIKRLAAQREAATLTEEERAEAQEVMVDAYKSSITTECRPKGMQRALAALLERFEIRRKAG